MRICLDFDGVLHDPTNRDTGYRMGKPVHGALKATQALLAEGHHLTIHTARATNREDLQHVYDWLAYFNFSPTILVLPTKPLADVYLDDKGLRFVSWPEAMAQLAQLDSWQRSTPSSLPTTGGG